MRLEKIDLLRGISVIGMIFFHANYMLESIWKRDIIPLPDRFWDILGFTVALMFIFLSGFVSFLAWEGRSRYEIFLQASMRFLELFFIALGISYITFTFFPSQKISWGIIYFFALSALIFPLFHLTRKYNIILWILVILIGYTIRDIRVDTDILIPLWFIPVWYFSADYYPLFPWFGWSLIWAGCAYSLKRRDLLSFLHSGWGQAVVPIRYIWRHALLFYVIHVPVLFIVLYFLF